MIPSTRIKRLHFIGIGGSGMSGMAEVLHENGFVVNGSDMQESASVRYLQEKGLSVRIGHRSENVGDADLVVYSSAVKMDNPEVVEARSRNIPIIRRAEMLGELMRMKYTIAVAGTHGKTTTTSMVGSIWEEAQKDPTIIVGGILQHLGSGARPGHGDVLIAEADEYDRSFLSMMPTLALVTNVDEDHLDCYEDLDDIKNAFSQFLNKVPFYGQIVLCIDDEGVKDILPRVERSLVTYGFSTQADYRVRDVDFVDNKTRFSIEHRGNRIGPFDMSLVGKHNVLNAAGAIAIAIEEGIMPEHIYRGLLNFKGVKRRLELLGQSHEISVFDDYAHHPTEVAATLQGVREFFPDRRIHVVFQPHLYSRTQDQHEEFGASFSECDTLIVTGIYGAREKPMPGVDGGLIRQSALKRGHRNSHYIEDWNAVCLHLLEVSHPGDLIILMGAGDIWKLGNSLLERLWGDR
jgi:UDP-N-acetylmuramate--alanine ligase